MTATEALREALRRAMDEGRIQIVGRDHHGEWLIVPEGCPLPPGFETWTRVRPLARTEEPARR
jgi:hypothetical protein